MNKANFRRSRTQRALDLATCLLNGHVWAEHAPDTCTVCTAKRGGYDPATVENVVVNLHAALGPWPPNGSEAT